MAEQKLQLPLADNIRALRKSRKLSQAALGAKVGLSRSNIASYENAKAEPRAAKLAEIAQFFAVSIEQLITGDCTQEAMHSRSAVLPVPQATREQLQLHLAGFDQRNHRLRHVLRNLGEQIQRLEDAQLQDDLQRLTQHFENILLVMEELLRNDEEMVGVLQTVTTTTGVEA